MLSEQFLSDLKYRNDVVEVIGGYVELKRRGRNLVGLCPFHNEKTPSFTVYPESQSFYCFGCGTGGDLITFIRKVENLEYIEAVKWLANRAGMQMPADEYDDREARLRARVLEINREAARFYHASLLAPGGARAREYLTGRGLSENIIRRFGIGYAPDSWDATLKYLTGKGFRTEELDTARMVARSSRTGGYYDQFRGRVMFPIIDIRGGVIAFGGRVMEGSGPKYLNSPDTPVFKKSRNLFALNFAKSAGENRLILAEGYMDVVALHQAGFTASVATLGTALTKEQARLISQYAQTVVVAYDADGAGQSATNRAINIFGELGIQVKILKMTGAKDPDEFIQKFGAKRFGLLLDGSSGAIDFEIARIREKYDTETSEGRVGFLKEFVRYIAGIRNQIERDVYLGKVAAETGVDKDVLAGQLRSILRQQERDTKRKERRDLSNFAVTAADRSDPQRREHIKAALAEDRLLCALVKNPDYAGEILQKITPADFVTDFNRRIFSIVAARIAEGRSVELIAMSEALSEEEMARLSRILAEAEGKAITRQEADDYIRAIHAERARKSPDQIAGMDEQALADYIAGLAAQKK